MAEQQPLQIQGLHHRFGSVVALDDVSLNVGEGEFVALLGPSGCGKTTLLRAIAGLVPPQDGHIQIAGKEVQQAARCVVPAEQRKVGFVFQDYALFPHMTVKENVGFGLRPPDPKRVADLLERLDLAALADRLPANLSGGQQQRVALARALAPRPALLLLDEPFANVDAALRDTLASELVRVVRQENASVLMVTHDYRTALSVADRVVVMDEGKVVQCGTPMSVYRQPSSRLVARLTGTVAFVDGAASGGQAETGLGEVSIDGNHSGAVTLALRPHQLRFVPDEAGTHRLCEVRYTGAAHRLCCDGPCQGIEVVSTGTSTPPPVGTRGRIEVMVPAWVLPA